MYNVYVFNILLIFLFISTTFLAFGNAQGVIFPIAVAIIYFRERIQRYLWRFSAGVTFISIGIFLGLLTEFFAILGNSNLPASEKILLHPDPIADMFIGFFYYSLVIVTWYFLVRRYRFSKKVVFALTGIFGILAEQAGAIFFGIFANPLLGIPMALIIACVYGIFPTIAYLFAEKKFSVTRIVPVWYHYVLASFMIFLQWAIFGNFILPFFVEIFPK